MLPETIFVTVAIILFIVTSAILIKIGGFSTRYRTLTAHVSLWDKPKKPASTIYELNQMPRPSALVESHYVLSNNSERWFSIGLLVSLSIVFCAPVLIGCKYYFFDNPTKEELDVILLLQITVISVSSAWFFKCFGAMKVHEKKICELEMMPVR